MGQTVFWHEMSSIGQYPIQDLFLAMPDMIGSLRMVKDFEFYIAWTDAMNYGSGFAGLIGYQRKSLDGVARLLWVVGPELGSESEAECSAAKMLDQITDITRFGRIIYADGVML